MNRIIAAIERQKIKIEENTKLKGLTQEKLAETHKNLDMPFDEFATFQEIKNLAMMHGKLSLDEAQTVYFYLGESPEHFNRQSLEVKACLTNLFAQLLSLKIAGKFC